MHKNFLCRQITENVWNDSTLLKHNKGMLYTPDLVWCAFFKGEVTNIFKKHELVDFVFMALQP